MAARKNGKRKGVIALDAASLTNEEREHSVPGGTNLIKQTDREVLVSKVQDFQLGVLTEDSEHQFIRYFARLCHSRLGIGEKQVMALNRKQISDLGELLLERTRTQVLIQNIFVFGGLPVCVSSIAGSLLAIGTAYSFLTPLLLIPAALSGLSWAIAFGDDPFYYRKYHQLHDFLRKHRGSDYFPFKALEYYNENYNW